jgi:hypothetical protein
MRMSVKLALGIALVAGWTASANAEYFNRYTDGSWTNAEYDDGTCHYYYSYDSRSGETHVNRYGNCARVAIASDGRPMPIVPAQPLPPMR